MGVGGLRGVAHNNHFGAVGRTRKQGFGLVALHVLELVVNDKTIGERASTHIDNRLKFDFVVFDETFELVVSGAEANVAFFCQLFAIVAVLELQNLNVVVFYGLGFGASFVGGVSWEKTDFGAKSAIARANEDAFIDVCYAAVGKKMPRGEREKRFAGAENAGNNYDGDFLHRGEQGFHYHGLTS